MCYDSLILLKLLKGPIVILFCRFNFKICKKKLGKKIVLWFCNTYDNVASFNYEAICPGLTEGQCSSQLSHSSALPPIMLFQMLVLRNESPMLLEMLLYLYTVDNLLPPLSPLIRVHYTFLGSCVLKKHNYFNKSDLRC